MNRSNTSMNINLEVFVNKQLDEIEKQATGTSNKDKIIRQSCCFVKRIVSDYGNISPSVAAEEGELRDGSISGRDGHGTSGGLPEEVTVPLLSLLKSCLETKNERVIEPALSCLHKLIAYMYLQGETRPSGRLDDAENIVTTVVLMAAKAASTPFSNHSVQLTAVKTLLTATTAEYFIPHGDCLMLAVRTAFNIAINGVTKDVQNAAASGLLQMLNTLLKRVANHILTPCGTPIKSCDKGSDVSASNSGSRITKRVLEEHEEGLKHIETPQFSDTLSNAKECNDDDVVDDPVTVADQRAAQLSQLAEQSDVRGLEEALTQSIPSPVKPLKSIKTHTSREGILRPEAAKIGQSPRPGEIPSLRRVDTPPDPRRALMRDLRASEWKMLTTPEKDFVIVMSAMCKMASRETGSGAAGTYFHSGKLFALDTVVKVLTNPMHEWDYIRTELAIQLRQPLCLAILRNCKSPYESAITGSVNMLCAILSASPLRTTLRAEIGALYPLIILRPLEKGSTSHSGLQKHAMAALQGLEQICEHPQVLVDIFVNFDCSMQASNLFERTVNVLAREASNPSKQFMQGWASANGSLLKCIDSLDTWAGPLKPWLNDVSNLDDEASTEDLLHGRDQDVLRQIHLDKAKKSSLQEGLAYFNQDPIKGIEFIVEANVVESDSSTIAQFLIEHESALDPEAVGELLGHHDERSIKIMHAYVRKFKFSGLTVDAALRVMLRGFRLPGEAQKIDRIMEKFAEKYCEDNPNVFPIADAAYLLSFAVIMLNTDAHNPMAERRIEADDFVTMCMYQTENGEYEQIMPTKELLDLYARIVDEEIAVPESNRPISANQKSKSRSVRRLAAATGLSKLVAPFHAGNSWDKQYGADQERLEMDKLSMQISTFSSVISEKDMWKTATHAEHARPMLQVAGDPICKALVINLRAASSVAEAMPILKGFEQAIKLCALLWLENLTLQFVKGLAVSSGFGLVDDDFSIAQCAPPGTSEEAKNVACLSRLMSLACSKEAGMLGGAWIIVFKLLSGLEKLKEHLSPEIERPLPSNLSLKWIRRSFSKHQAQDSSSRKAGKGPTRTVLRDSQGPLIIREEPGMGIVIWAETSGAVTIERIFANSVELDGESILTFMRALCAISQEELEHTGDSSTRIYLLQRAVECSYFNAGRIRLVWQKIWTVVSQHLVSAACCSDTYVAMFAVDALRQLADKLLCRTELAGFASQGEAIRPLGSVIRCSDATAVRELSIACLAHIVDSHQERIAGGWWAVIDALAISASDASSEVVTQSIDIMRKVFKLLFRDSEKGIGHELLDECVHAGVAVVANQTCEEDTGPATAALELFQTLCQQLYDSNKERRAIQRWISVLSPLTAISRSDPRPEVADTASTVLFYALTTYGDCFDSVMWENIFEVVISPVLSVYPRAISQDLIDMIMPNAQFAEHPSSLKESKDVFKFYTDYNSYMHHDNLWTRESSLRIVRLANSHLPSLWDNMSICPMACHLIVHFLKILWSYSVFEDEMVAEISEPLCERMFSIVYGSILPGSWRDISRVFQTWLSFPEIDELVPDQAASELQRRCNSVIKGFNVVKWILLNCSVPQDFAWDILQVMQSSTEAVWALNNDQDTRRRLRDLLNRSDLKRKATFEKEPESSSQGRAADRFESLADAVIETVVSTDEDILPAFSRVETLGERAYLDSIMYVASGNMAGIEKQDELYAMAVDCIVSRVQQSCESLDQIASSDSSDTLWLETERVSSSASLLPYLLSIPQACWQNKRNDMIKCASQMVRFQNITVRKSVSTFFQRLGEDH